MIPWNQITFIGDSVITMPAAAAILVWLLSAGAWRMALQWCVLFGGSIFLVVASKVAFIGWGIGIPGLDFTGISGHAARAAAVLPVIACLLLQQASTRVRRVGVALACAGGMLVGASRVVLGQHSISEAVAGVVLGLLVASIFIGYCERANSLRLRRWVVGISMLLMAPTTYAEPAPSQQWVTSIALYLSGHDRPYIRTANGGKIRAPQPATEI